MSTTHVWIVGAGGLLGKALSRELNRNPSFTLFTGQEINWTNSDQINQTFEQDFHKLVDQAGTNSWTVVWAAGRASTSTTKTDTETELATFRSLIEVISNTDHQGTFFLTSSAGGVYAGSSNPPFSIDTIPQPLSPYGELKLAQEKVAKEQLPENCKVIIGRVSNLFGPGQDVNKLQGLISQLVVSALTKKPIDIFVSLDTLRDYIYVDDAAKIIANLALNESRKESTHIIASGQPVSLGYLIQLAQDISRTRIPIAIGAHASSAAQARDLRLTPTENPNNSNATTLPAGIKNVYLDILQRRQNV
jgi:UDP-glucose 4-epimerase